MAERQKFDYEQFRQQAVQKLRSGETNLASLHVLLAPVAIDLFDALLLPDNHQSGKVEKNVPPVGAKKTNFQPDNRHQPHKSRSRANFVPRPTSRISAAEQQALDLFDKGRSHYSIQRSLADRGHDLDIVEVKQITDQALPKIDEWRRQPLQPVYAYVCIANLSMQVPPDSQSRKGTAYVAVGIDLHGRRDILGYYIGEGDSLEFWSEILSDFQIRGVADILITCVNEPTTIGQQVRTFYPHTHVHGSLLLQLQTSLTILAGSDKDTIKKTLQALYTASDEAQAAKTWQAVKASWSERYPMVIESWERNWTLLMKSMQYPPAMRRYVHRIPFLDTLRNDLHRFAKEDGPYSNENDFFKSAYQISRRMLSNYKVGISPWGLLTQQLAQVFSDRATKNLII